MVTRRQAAVTNVCCGQASSVIAKATRWVTINHPLIAFLATNPRPTKTRVLKTNCNLHKILRVMTLICRCSKSNKKIKYINNNI